MIKTLPSAPIVDKHTAPTETPVSTGPITSFAALPIKDRLIYAQNVMGHVQASPEWANISLTLSESERDARLAQLAQVYFNLGLQLAGLQP